MIYFILFIFSFIFTYIIKNYYIRNALFDEINERSSHSIPTPHGGGIAITLTWFIGLFYLYFTNQIEANLFYSFLVGVIISIVSFFDDIYKLSAKVRLFVQFIVSIMGLYFLGGLDKINLFIYDIENVYITNIFAIFLIIWYINLYNFLDGLNGYAGSEAFFLGLAGFIFFQNAIFLVFMASVLGFLYWNINKAKIFMGDVGSTLLGYNIAIFTIYYANIDSKYFWIWIMLFGLFWFDATLTLLRRKLKGEKLSQAHKKHAYQRLNQAGWSHFKVTNYAFIINMILFLVVFYISNIFLAFIIIMIFLYAIIRYIDYKKDFE